MAICFYDEVVVFWLLSSTKGIAMSLGESIKIIFGALNEVVDAAIKAARYSQMNGAAEIA